MSDERLRGLERRLAQDPADAEAAQAFYRVSSRCHGGSVAFSRLAEFVGAREAGAFVMGWARPELWEMPVATVRPGGPVHLLDLPWHASRERQTITQACCMVGSDINPAHWRWGLPTCKNCLSKLIRTRRRMTSCSLHAGLSPSAAWRHATDEERGVGKTKAVQYWRLRLALFLGQESRSLEEIAQGQSSLF